MRQVQHRGSIAEAGRGEEDALMTLQHTVAMLPGLVLHADLGSATLRLLDLAIEHLAAAEAAVARPLSAAPPPPGLLALLRDPAVRAAAEQGARNMTKRLRAPGEEAHLRQWAERAFGRAQDKASLAREVQAQVTAAVERGAEAAGKAANASIGEKVFQVVERAGAPSARAELWPGLAKEQGIYANVGYYVVNRSRDASRHGWAMRFNFEPTWISEAGEDEVTFGTPVSLDFEFRGFLLGITTDFKKGWWAAPSPENFQPLYLAFRMAWYRDQIGPNLCDMCRLGYGGGAFIEAKDSFIDVTAAWDGKAHGLDAVDLYTGPTEKHMITKEPYPTFWVGPSAAVRLTPKLPHAVDHFLRLRWVVFIDLDLSDDKTEVTGDPSAHRAGKAAVSVRP